MQLTARDADGRLMTTMTMHTPDNQPDPRPSFACRMARHWTCRPTRPRVPPAWTCAPQSPPIEPHDACRRESGRWCRPGFIFEIPAGYEAQIRPRSGLAFKHGITCLNTPGTIDSDYRGEVKVLLVNLGDGGFRHRARHAHRPDGDRPGDAGDRPRGRRTPATRHAGPAASARRASRPFPGSAKRFSVRNCVISKRWIR